MKKMIEIAFRAYSERKETIEPGIITYENIKWVTDKLMLQHLTNAELSEMWEAVNEFFRDMMAEYDEDGNVVAWKPFTEEIRFAMDTDSAWKEVINLEARRRKELGVL